MKLKTILVLLYLLPGIDGLIAQIPSNDECTGAIQVPVNGDNTCNLVLNATTGIATQSFPPCYGTSAHDVWYKFTATASVHRICITPVSYCNLVFQLYSGSCGNLVSISCVYPTGLNEQVIGLFNSLVVGSEYYIRVYDRAGNEPNFFDICINSATSFITNDECTGAINIIPGIGDGPGSCDMTTLYTNLGATQSMPGCVGAAEDDIWFKFTATGPRHQIFVSTSQDIYPVIEIFSNVCGNLVSLACFNYETGGNGYSLSADISNLTVGNVYYYRVYGELVANNRANITTCIKTLPPGPANDECTGAIQVPVNAGNTCNVVLNTTTAYATQTLPPCVGEIAKDVWYKFTATATIHRICITPVSYGNLVFQLYSGSCGNLASMSCVYPSGYYEQVIGLFSSLVVGSEYYIRVYDRYGNSPDLNFDICINSATSMQPNDECTGAISIVPGPDEGALSCGPGPPRRYSNLGATQSMPGCIGTAEDDIWFKFLATGTRHKIFVNTWQSIYPVIEVFKNACGSLISMGCFNYSSTSVTADLSNFIPGNIYYYRIYGQSATNSRTDIQTCIKTSAVLSPCSGGSISYVSNLFGSSYQWQENTGSGFTNITDDDHHVGTNTDTLQLRTLPAEWYGYQYRCVVNGSYSSIYTLKFTSYWNGSVSNDWENPNNWSCSTLPGINTDVVITTGQVFLNSNRSCRSLEVKPGVVVTVNSGSKLTITH